MAMFGMGVAVDVGGVTEIAKSSTVPITATGAFNIPTTKKAKGFVFYYKNASNDVYMFTGFDGVNDNKLFSFGDGSYLSVTATYSNNSIAIPSISSSQRDYYAEIFY